MTAAAHGGMVWGADGNRNVRLDFSASIWPERGVVIPKGLRTLLESYPDPDCRGLVRAAAAHYGAAEAGVLACNGSSEGLFLAMHALRPRTLTVADPTFAEYESAFAFTGGPLTAIRRIATTAECGFMPELEAAESDLTVLGHPNNPTGTLIPRARLLPWIEAAVAAGRTVVIDEAFMDFVEDAPGSTLIPEIERNPHLLVLRSMTKRFGIAGVRLGFVLGHPDTIARLRGLRIPWSVNTLAQRLGTQLAERPADAGFAARIALERAYLERGLSRLGFRVFPSAANFLLLSTPGCRPHGALLAALAKRGILLRDASNFRGLDDTYLRCAVRPRAESRQLLRALGDLV